MTASKDRENFVYIAKLAEQAERYEEMVESMKNVANLDVELTVEKQKPFWNGTCLRQAFAVFFYRCSNGRRRQGGMYRMHSGLRSIGTQGRIGAFLNMCNEMSYERSYDATSCSLRLSQWRILPVFSSKMKRDSYRYLAEYKSAYEKKESADQSMIAYASTTTAPEYDFSPPHPIGLGRALNFSVFYPQILNSPERPCHHAKLAFDEVISDPDTSNEESSKDSPLITQLFRVNLTFWTSATPEDGEDAQKVNGSGNLAGGEDAE
uniref:14-3-3-like protein D n=1 Tax=Phaseolus vulgaris TaxID=3885 RepID=T2DN83_PHAVU|nr:14-3-3-like protein D [Phaseolus vulgaris]